MKIAIIILGILGSLASLGLGSIWVNDYNKNKDLIESAADSGLVSEDDHSMVELKQVVNAGYSLIVLGLVSLIVSIMVGKLKKVTGIILLIAVAVPAFFTMKSLLATFLLLIAAILAFVMKPKAVEATSNP